MTRAGPWHYLTLGVVILALAIWVNECVFIGPEPPPATAVPVIVLPTSSPAPVTPTLTPYAPFLMDSLVNTPLPTATPTPTSTPTPEPEPTRPPATMVQKG
jgi:hypothetical protein